MRNTRRKQIRKSRKTKSRKNTRKQKGGCFCGFCGENYNNFYCKTFCNKAKATIHLNSNSIKTERKKEENKEELKLLEVDLKVPKVKYITFAEVAKI